MDTYMLLSTEWVLEGYLTECRKIPTNILHWELIKWAVENGYKKYDMIGATIPGIIKFKKSFNFELVEYVLLHKYKTNLVRVYHNLYKILVDRVIKMSDIRKTIALGLDGATWRLLDPLIRGGKLPSLKRIMDEGVYANMQSAIPPVTCPAWKCYSTGKNPGKLGVFWWAGFDKEKGRVTVPHSYSFKSRDLWDCLGDAGKKVAIINMPTTYPPKHVNGIMISGFGTPIGKNLDFQQYTYPRELQEGEDSELKWRTIVYQKVGTRGGIKKRIRDLKKTGLV